MTSANIGPVLMSQSIHTRELSVLFVYLYFVCIASKVVARVSRLPRGEVVLQDVGCSDERRTLHVCSREEEEPKLNEDKAHMIIKGGRQIHDLPGALSDCLFRREATTLIL